MFEASAWGGYLWRDGDALNSAGVPDEVEDFPLAGGDLTFAAPVYNHFLVQLELSGELAFSNDDIGGVTADDTYDGGFTGGGHVAYRHGDFLFGAFGGGGQTNFTDADADQDADHWLAGGEIRYLANNVSLAVQVGYLDSRADNMETLSDATFGRVVGKHFFNNGQTAVSASVAYADGTQDEDDAPFDNSANLWAWDVTLEHQLAMISGAETAGSVFVSYQGVRVRENSTSGFRETITDQGIFAGLSFRFGASDSLYERDMRMAPDLPRVHRWLGAVPAVD